MFRGSESVFARVHVPEPVTIENDGYGPGHRVNIEGTGRFIGFAITKDVPGRNKGALIAGIIPTQPWSQTDFLFFLPFGGIGNFDRVTLPEGDFRLYLLADGSPVTVTLLFPNLDGAIELSPTVKNPFVARIPTPHISIGPSTPLYTAGETAELNTLGAGFQIAWIDTGTAHAASHLGVCLHAGDPPSDAYLPGCGTIEQLIGGGFTVLAPGVDRWLYAEFSAQLPLAVGEWGMGGYVETASVLADPKVLVFWLELS